jgi:hypothetical protein
LNGTNTIDLPAASSWIIPAGTWLITPGRYTTVQYYDPLTLIWRGISSWNRYVSVNSDGVNFRVANQTGTPLGAVITNAGSGYTSAPVVTASAGADQQQHYRVQHFGHHHGDDCWQRLHASADRANQPAGSWWHSGYGSCHSWRWWRTFQRYRYEQWRWLFLGSDDSPDSESARSEQHYRSYCYGCCDHGAWCFWHGGSSAMHV